ncbi:sensor histidine kinase [Nocardia stercoris]|uniref:histidine kinase n=1 Tax=Nocardia stercoris TaxID=2483361 RepID=A0A3M2LD46_9NOCA|nr:histidine kinase [Nocardia stercoris]RMI35449.1 histidine kinase [Nocardia stercoris]
MSGTAASDLPELPTTVRGRLAAFRRNPAQTVSRVVAEQGHDYSASTILMSDLAIVLVALVSVGLRYHYLPTLVPILAALIVLAPYPVLLLTTVKSNPMVFGLPALTGTALFLAQPVYPDCAVLVPTIVVAEITAIAGARAAAPYMVAGMAMMVGFSMVGEVDKGLPMYLTSIPLGVAVGLMIRFQRQALYQERENQAIRAVQAADDERRRIAREVHDVVAHSLSVTLLHLTAARHTLQTDRDVDEAVDALIDAERIGRQAMADIRRTVGLLDQQSGNERPEPGLDDIGVLVADFVRAGMAVDYSLTGDPTLVSAATGLALYRICQESLANVAKHAQGVPAEVRITVGTNDVALEVRNARPAGAASQGRGMGIDGMTRRSAQLGGTLTAGQAGAEWLVRSRIPLGVPGAATNCPMAGEAPTRLLRTAITAISRKPQEEQ